MDSSFWHTRWQENKIGFHQGNTNPQLERFWPRLGVTPPGRVLVPLCGKSLDMIWLDKQGWDVLGIELSPLAIEAFFAENKLVAKRTKQYGFEIWQSGRITIGCGDFFELQPEFAADIRAVYDRAALIALPESSRARYVNYLLTLLQSARPYLLVTLEYPSHQMEGPPFSVPENEIQRLYARDYIIERVHQEDALEPASHFRDKGVTEMTETVYLLQPRETV